MQDLKVNTINGEEFSEIITIDSKFCIKCLHEETGKNLETVNCRWVHWTAIDINNTVSFSNIEKFCQTCGDSSIQHLKYRW